MQIIFVSCEVLKFGYDNLGLVGERMRNDGRKAANRDPFTYFKLPRATRNGIIWNEFELVIRDPTKGIGLVAKKDLPKNLCIPYGGKCLTPREWKHLYKHCNDGGFHRISHTAEEDYLRDDGEVELGALDAHPTRM
jgi:hypothetical protein